MLTHRYRPALLLAAGLLLSPLAGAEALNYNQVSLRAEATREVPRDLMNVTLYTEDQGRDPAQLAKGVSETLNKALAQARAVEGVTVRVGTRQSYPVYDDKGQKITAWRERAELRLESQDFPALSKLTGELQQSLKLSGMSFDIAHATRKENEDALLKEAVADFKARAQHVAEAMGGTGYRVVSLNLDSDGQVRFPVAPAPMMMKAARADSAPVTPDVEAGTTEVQINASGVIEVQMP
ncbi:MULTISPECIES: SIMPL domain-containing protein [unclassified Pseudomonas]|uniref:SIMPL domain-containing protein n=1 Tax=unclassified Pseudomonas TaxID=196821 RepID=UPI000BC8905E|nr:MULTISPECIES: SIMPL domain-containing protein [unclassified Pseudomonas]PVZ12359.1 putative secreted protein [Pseudomonas sp. URIL14HWK12:I12]PVZ23489.1 putative secreted protein [Pseudomonas sp. URIL14HWK12:I10]PVZ32819.1 putative secreted protein [Pseudomonas sp. URIL14HWK12:I11]SNZ14183.1 Predicted secreted protein [Pseudomonas sp. URIL14HWK12:I9]